MNFKQWLANEMMGSVMSIVSCKDLKNKNFQIQGALSNLKCKKNKKWLQNEALANKKQYDDAMQAAISLNYQGIDPEKATSKEIEDELLKAKRKPPEGVSMPLFIARIKSVAKGNTIKKDFNT